MEQVKKQIEQNMHELSDLYFRTAAMRAYAHQFISEKLLEPQIFGALTVWHYHRFGGTEDSIYRVAAGVELLILSSDILDDLQDQDAPSMPWMQIPPAEALNVAVGLLLVGQQSLIQLLHEPNIRLSALELVQDKLLCSLNGQMTDLQNDVEDTDKYLEMIKEKSASLFVMACGLGALMASGERHYLVEEYAEYMGLSAQLNNDCQDIFNWSEKGDFKRRKRTFPILYLMECVEGENLWLKTYIEEGHIPSEINLELNVIKSLCEQYGIILFTKVQMRMYYYEFLERFDSIPETKAYKEEFLRTFAVAPEPLKA